MNIQFAERAKDSKQPIIRVIDALSRSDPDFLAFGEGNPAIEALPKEAIRDIATDIVTAAGIYRTVAVLVNERTVRLFTAEDSHIVAAVRIEEAIRYKQVIIALVAVLSLHVFNVRTFSRDIISACRLLAHVCVRDVGYRFIFHVIIAQTCFFVKLKHIYATEP